MMKGVPAGMVWPLAAVKLSVSVLPVRLLVAVLSVMACTLSPLRVPLAVRSTAKGRQRVFQEPSL
jgi:hypothetical protein